MMFQQPEARSPFTNDGWVCLVAVVVSRPRFFCGEYGQERIVREGGNLT